MKVIQIAGDAARPGGNEHFVGQVDIQPILGGADGLAVAVVRFGPGARTYLHSHDAVQVLHCIEGTGILATERERNTVTPGMVVHVPAGELHWHGATEDSSFVHVSIRLPGETRWTKTDPLAPAAG